MGHDPQQTAERLHMARFRKGLSLRELAKEVGTSPSTLHRIEQGQRDQVSFGLMIRIADALGCTLDELAGRNGQD